MATTLPFLLISLLTTIPTIHSDAWFGSDFHCNGRNQCYDDQIHCEESTKCTITCNGPNACQYAIIHCPINADCDIHCKGGIDACKDVVFLAQKSTSLSIHCDRAEDEACDETLIYCPNNGRLGPIQCQISGVSQVNVKTKMEIFAIEGLNDVSITGTYVNNALLYCGSHYQFGCTLSDVSPFKHCISADQTCENYRIPSAEPTQIPTNALTDMPTIDPTNFPTDFPSELPTFTPTHIPTDLHTIFPTNDPTNFPTDIPTPNPTKMPILTDFPTRDPTGFPTDIPTYFPTKKPTKSESITTTKKSISTGFPTTDPTYFPTKKPTKSERITTTEKAILTVFPTIDPTDFPTDNPSFFPTKKPTKSEGASTTKKPNMRPSMPGGITWPTSAPPTVQPTTERPTRYTKYGLLGTTTTEIGAEGVIDDIEEIDPNSERFADLPAQTQTTNLSALYYVIGALLISIVYVCCTLVCWVRYNKRYNDRVRELKRHSRLHSPNIGHPPGVVWHRQQIQNSQCNFNEPGAMGHNNAINYFEHDSVKNRNRMASYASNITAPTTVSNGIEEEVQTIAPTSNHSSPTVVSNSVHSSQSRYSECKDTEQLIETEVQNGTGFGGESVMKDGPRETHHLKVSNLSETIVNGSERLVTRYNSFGNGVSGFGQSREIEVEYETGHNGQEMEEESSNSNSNNHLLSPHIQINESLSMSPSSVNRQ